MANNAWAELLQAFGVTDVRRIDKDNIYVERSVWNNNTHQHDRKGFVVRLSDVTNGKTDCTSFGFKVDDLLATVGP